MKPERLGYREKRFRAGTLCHFKSTDDPNQIDFSKGEGTAYEVARNGYNSHRINYRGDEPE